jgi:hypothetical protein
VIEAHMRCRTFTYDGIVQAIFRDFMHGFVVRHFVVLFEIVLAFSTDFQSFAYFVQKSTPHPWPPYSTKTIALRTVATKSRFRIGNFAL